MILLVTTLIAVKSCVGSEKLNILCHISKQGCHSLSAIAALQGEPVSPKSTQEGEEYLQSSSHPWVRKIPLEKEMATHSSFLAWRIPWTEETDGLQSVGLQRVGHN